MDVKAKSNQKHFTYSHIVPAGNCAMFRIWHVFIWEKWPSVLELEDPNVLGSIYVEMSWNNNQVAVDHMQKQYLPSISLDHAISVEFLNLEGCTVTTRTSTSDAVHHLEVMNSNPGGIELKVSSPTVSVDAWNPKYKFKNAVCTRYESMQ